MNDVSGNGVSRAQQRCRRRTPGVSTDSDTNTVRTTRSIGKITADELYRVAADRRAGIGLHKDADLTDRVSTKRRRADDVVGHDRIGIEVGRQTACQDTVTDTNDSVGDERVVVVVFAVRRRRDGSTAHDNAVGRQRTRVLRGSAGKFDIANGVARRTGTGTEARQPDSRRRRRVCRIGHRQVTARTGSADAAVDRNIIGTVQLDDGSDNVT